MALEDIEWQNAKTLLREYLRHTQDSHGYYCDWDITPAERADGIHCICGLDQPKRYRNAAWEAKYGELEKKRVAEDNWQRSHP